MRKLLILGAGEYGKVAKEIAEAMQVFDEISFLDDKCSAAIGKLNDYERYVGSYDSAIAAIGNTEMRLKLIEQLEKTGYNVPVLIHSRAYVAPSAVIGKGSFVEPMAVIHTDTYIGTGCIISAGTIVNHNANIGEGCHLNCGTIVKARAVINKAFRSDYSQIIG